MDKNTAYGLPPTPFPSMTVELGAPWTTGNTTLVMLLRGGEPAVIEDCLKIRLHFNSLAPFAPVGN